MAEMSGERVFSGWEELADLSTEVTELVDGVVDSTVL